MSVRMLVEVDDKGIATLGMNDVEGKNILGEHFVRDFVAAVDELEARDDVKVCILRGLPDVFCGGGEKEMLLGLCDGVIDTGDLIVSEKLVSITFPVIAAMEGHAMGGGFVMASCCDLVVAAKESRYGAVFMNMGFTPGMGCTTLIELLVGPFVAAEMMYTGRRYRGSRLAAMATNINRIVPREKVMEEARDLAVQIADKNLRTLRLLKHALSARKKKLLIEARLQEDLMHQLSFSFPETRRTIEDTYVE